eukprot:TRINITY_DN1822_c0_g1_i14.p1 TRINITY_DN1822_c0_g1~~TRINITY_DN1822_c0_g1_i14.p1  ORF type:complete len:223 (+),score=43.61 TRINITY_DN1822_c0_g1_i14:138-806(+)
MVIKMSVIYIATIERKSPVAAADSCGLDHHWPYIKPNDTYKRFIENLPYNSIISKIRGRINHRIKVIQTRTEYNKPFLKFIGFTSAQNTFNRGRKSNIFGKNLGTIYKTSSIDINKQSIKKVNGRIIINNAQQIKDSPIRFYYSSEKATAKKAKRLGCKSYLPKGNLLTMNKSVQEVNKDALEVTDSEVLKTTKLKLKEINDNATVLDKIVSRLRVTSIYNE